MHQNEEHIMKQAIAAAALSASLLISTPALAAHKVEVQITNLSNGIYFTPLLVAVHDRHTHLFEVGNEASANLQAMAEGGDIAGLISDVEVAGGTYEADPAEGLLAPGASATARLTIHGYRHGRSHLSIVGMLLPTNDGFVGLDALRIPKWRGNYTYFLNGYDAGTEANDEIINGAGTPGAPGIPADPGGNGGTGSTGAEAPDPNQIQNPNVHIHRGVLGDTDLAGGISDVDSRVHRWLNPVARVVITVK
jgi:hypothetical protein